MKHFVSGCVLALAAALIGFLMDDWTWLWIIAGAIGVLAIIWGILVFAVFGKSGGSSRNLASEKRREKQIRFEKLKNYCLLAVPNLVAAIIGVTVLS